MNAEDKEQRCFDIEPPEEYRLLAHGEKVLPGDLHWNTDEGLWCEIVYVPLDMERSSAQIFARRK